MSAPFLERGYAVKVGVRGRLRYVRLAVLSEDGHYAELELTLPKAALLARELLRAAGIRL